MFSEDRSGKESRKTRQDPAARNARREAAPRAGDRAGANDTSARAGPGLAQSPPSRSRNARCYVARSLGRSRFTPLWKPRDPSSRRRALSPGRPAPAAAARYPHPAAAARPDAPLPSPPARLTVIPPCLPASLPSVLTSVRSPFGSMVVCGGFRDVNLAALKTPCGPAAPIFVQRDTESSGRECARTRVFFNRGDPSPLLLSPPPPPPPQPSSCSPLFAAAAGDRLYVREYDIPRK